MNRLRHWKMFFCKNKNRVSVNLEVVGEDKRRSGIISKSIDTYGIDATNIVVYEKTKEEEELILSALKKNEFLSNILQGKRAQDVVRCMYSKTVSPGEILIRQGEIGSHLFISNSGSYDVLVHENHVASFSDARVFGELAILYSSKRHATIRVVEKGSVWVLDCPTYKKLVIKSAIEEQEEMVSFLKNVPKLNTVAKEKLYLVSNLLRTEFFPSFMKIVRQCEIGNKFYIIRAGSVSVEKDNVKVAQLSKGEYFGELALLKDEFRQATVIADQPGVECLTLTRKEFILHFGDIDEFLKLKTTPVAHMEKLKEFTNLALEDLNIVQTIGTGAYGRVMLVQHIKQKNYVFALKCIRKSDIYKKSHQDQVFNEKNLQMICNSPFIARMYRTFKDSKYLYFLLESCLGGDLWGLLHKQKKRIFDESDAKFYSGCVLEGIAYLHDLGIIYRDLKPENVVIHHSGYPKLADFGFAKKNDFNERTYTFVGTAEYVAPEIIHNKGYNNAVDYWAFGIFIYEILVGRTPFRTNDPGHLRTYNLILRGIGEVLFPSVTKKAKNLIKKLCTTDPTERLGCLKGGIEDIRSHPWFSDLDWQKLRNLELEPPRKPKLEHIIDTRYFEKFKEDDAIPRDNFSDWDEEF